MTIAWSIWAASMLVFPLLTVAGSVGEWNSAFSDSTFSASLPFHNVAIAGPVFLFGNWIACYLLPLDDRCSWMFWPSANAIVSSTMHTAAIVAVYFVFGVRQYFDISQNMCVVDLVPVSKNGSPSKVAPKKPASSPAKTTASLKKVVSSPVRKVSPAKTTTSPAKKSSPSKEPVVVIKAPETPTKRGRKSSPTEVKVAPPKKKDSLSKGSPFKNGALLSRSVSRIRKEGRSRSRSRSPRKTGALKK